MISLHVYLCMKVLQLARCKPLAYQSLHNFNWPNTCTCIYHENWQTTSLYFHFIAMIVDLTFSKLIVQMWPILSLKKHQLKPKKLAKIIAKAAGMSKSITFKMNRIHKQLLQPTEKAPKLHIASKVSRFHKQLQQPTEKANKLHISRFHIQLANKLHKHASKVNRFYKQL